MLKFATIRGKRCTIVSSETPSKGELPRLNRQQRRALIYAHPLMRLHGKVEELRKDMKAADIRLPAMPKARNRKTLSGHMSHLVRVVGMAEV